MDKKKREEKETIVGKKHDLAKPGRSQRKKRKIDIGFSFNQGDANLFGFSSENKFDPEPEPMYNLQSRQTRQKERKEEAASRNPYDPRNMFASFGGDLSSSSSSPPPPTAQNYPTPRKLRSVKEVEDDLYQRLQNESSPKKEEADFGYVNPFFANLSKPDTSHLYQTEYIPPSYQQGTRPSDLKNKIVFEPGEIDNLLGDWTPEDDPTIREEIVSSNKPKMSKVGEVFYHTGDFGDTPPAFVADQTEGTTSSGDNPAPFEIPEEHRELQKQFAEQWKTMKDEPVETNKDEEPQIQEESERDMKELYNKYGTPGQIITSFGSRSSKFKPKDEKFEIDGDLRKAFRRFGGGPGGDYNKG